MPPISAQSAAKQKAQTKTSVIVAPTAKRKKASGALPPPPANVRQGFTFLDELYTLPWDKRPMRVAYGVYALGLLASHYDFNDLWDDAVVDGGNDKDVDLCLVDEDGAAAYIVQSVLSENWGKPEASTNKADDLLSAFNYLVHTDLSAVPEELKPKAEELRKAIADQKVETIYIALVHNCHCSGPVKQSLSVAADACQKLVGSTAVRVTSQELGLESVQGLYDAITKPIVVEDKITIAGTAESRESGPGWKAFATTIKGSQLHQLYNQYGEKLFSANLRGFLDMLRRKASVNRGMSDTIDTAPGNFWVFNNGITAITRKCRKGKDGLTVTGLGIINGAQTTGVIGRAEASKVKTVRVPIRIVECVNEELIRDIVKWNNTQNQIKPFDLQSNDPVQRRLRDDFAKFNIEYVHRRAGSGKIPATAIQAESVAPMLAAFHGDFQIAARSRRKIFEDDATYNKVFPKNIRCEHVFMVQCLSDAIGLVKDEFAEKHRLEQANDVDRKCHELLRHSTSKLFLGCVMGTILSQVLANTNGDPHAWMAAPQLVKADRKKLVNAWKIAVEAIVPLMAVLPRVEEADKYELVRSEEKMKAVATQLAGFMQSTKSQQDAGMSPIRDSLVLT